MTKRLWISVFASMLLAGAIHLVGCDDDPADGDGDGDGDADGDADGDSDGDAGPTLTEIEIAVYEATDEGDRGATLSGAHLALDTYTGRREYVSGDDGVVALAVEEDAEDFTITVGHADYYPVFTFYRTTFAEVAEFESHSSDGRSYVVLTPLDQTTDDTYVQLTVRTSGVPAGMNWCALAEGGAEWCLRPGDPVSFTVLSTGEPFRYAGYVLDPTTRGFAEPLDFSEGEVSDTLTDQEVELVFDGTPDVEPVEVEMTFELPDDDSVVNAAALHWYGAFPIRVFEEGTHLVRGGAGSTTLASDGRSADVTITYFPADGRNVNWMIEAYAVNGGTSASGNQAASFRYFATPPEPGSYGFMDAPRNLSPDTDDARLGARFLSQEIEEAATYNVGVFDRDWRLLWRLISRTTPDIEMPRLPDGFAEDAAWPSSGDVGIYRWWVEDTIVFEDTEVPDDRYLFEQQISRSEVVRLAFDWCDRDCDGRECGDDDCDGSCAPGCEAGMQCDDATGTCVACEPQCDGRSCGDDGCGGTCTPGCDATDVCSEATGACVPPAGDWVEVAAGTFTMGSPVEEEGRPMGDMELQHDVTLTRGFEILSTEVTQDDFEMVMGYNPAANVACGGACPVESLNMGEMAAYCNALSTDAGFELCYECTGDGTAVTCTWVETYETPYDCPGYRLPTEAEWEYAARAGSTTATYAGDIEDGRDCTDNDLLDLIAWWCGNSLGQSHPVGELHGNTWGLYDVLGNIAERCMDTRTSYEPEAVTDPFLTDSFGWPAIRGGTYLYEDDPATIRAANRYSRGEGWRHESIGFRPVRTLP